MRKLPPPEQLTPAPALSYRSAGTDPPASAGDVLKGAVAIAVVLLMLAAFVRVGLVAYQRAYVYSDWGPVDWVTALLLALLMALGAFAALRSVRHYLTGRHRRRLAALSAALSPEGPRTGT